MIQFSLRCANDHNFDSWFQSSEAYETLQKAGMVTCAVCGSAKVEKALMAPKVHDSRGRAKAVPDAPEPERPLAAPRNDKERALAELRRKVEQTSEYVGLNFAREARDMHNGLTPERPIYGEAKPEEAAKLIDEGVPVAPLPFIPGRKSN
jgi:hypothetical protein